jgi:putative membrane protein
MNDVFLVLGVIFASLAALIHLAIFVLESVIWSRPTTWKRFGVRSQEDADVLRPMAYNQGFYNIFLALGVVVGILMIGSEAVRQGGIALTIFSLLSMLLASIVLVSSNPRLMRAALFQGLTPLIGIIFFVLVLLG